MLLLAMLFNAGFIFSVSSADTGRSHIPAAARDLKAIGKPAPNSQINLAIGLPLRNQSTLSNLLSDIYNPASPRYHQYVTAEQFTAMFGPTEEDYEKLAAFVQSKGLTITARHPNRVLLDVRASVGEIEKAFHINLVHYQHPNEARLFFAPDREPVFDTDVPILHVSGLDDFVVPRPMSLHARPLDNTGPQPQVGSGPGGTYRGNDLKNAYAPVTLTGTGQMVGLLEFDTYYTNDVVTYASQANLAAIPRINVLLDDINTTPGSGNIEVALDIEMVNAMASGLSAVIVYQGVVGNDILNRMATDNLAKQLSASWTFAIDANTPQIFQQYAAQGQSYFNASGDNCAYTTGAPNPIDQPYVTAVGGTTLTTSGPLGSWVSEKVWNWNSTGAGTAGTGGGISTRSAIPSWQQGTSMASNQGSATMRNIPDVAMVADNVYVVANNGQGSSIAGTSVATPLWAAYIALVNQQAASLGQPPVGFINPVVYSIGNGPGYSTNFHDTVTGNNTNTASPSQFYAVAGYDLCTGWGSPIGNKLINTLVPRANAIFITNASSQLLVEGCSPPNSALDPGETATFLFGLKNIGGVATTNLVATLLATGGVLSPSAAQSYGVLNPGGSAVTRQFSFTAAGSCGGTVTATLQLSDGAASIGTITFLIPLGKPTTVFSQNFDSASRPALPGGWTNSSSGAAAAWITSTTLKDTTPNAAFISEPTNIGIADLSSPIVAIATTNAQLVFRQNYNTEIDVSDVTKGFDGGVLEISINGGAFADILAAGGSFLSNGYTRTLDATNDNPLAGRQAWCGLSSNFITTVIGLPASAAGQNVQFKWRFGTDTGNYYGGSGWYIDTVSVIDGSTCCSSTADLAISQAASANPVLAGQPLTYTLSISNLGPQAVSGLSVTDTIPANVTFSSASPGCVYSNGTVICSLGAMNPGDSNGVTITVTTAAIGPATNVVTVGGGNLPDPVSGNNASTNVVTVTSNVPPAFVLQPTNLIVFPGSNAIFLASATGVPSPTYQWLFNGANLSGATTTLLALSNAQPAQIGDYQAVASNAGGSATSSVAHLTVLVSPVIQVTGFGISGTNIAISLTSVSGLTYRLEYKNNLTDPVWIPAAVPVPGTGSIITLLDTNAPAPPNRFYHINTY
jgi:uncharacterized repeat protein (TIGR01451 family)